MNMLKRAERAEAVLALLVEKGASWKVYEQDDDITIRMRKETFIKFVDDMAALTAQPAEPVPDARCIHELSDSARKRALTAYKVAHQNEAAIDFAPDRAWLEGYAYAALAAQPAEPVTQGEWVRVPKEPTDTMIHAGYKTFPQAWADCHIPTMWTAMIAAAPAKPVTREAAAAALLQTAQVFWQSERNAGMPGAVKWLTGDDGALLIFTRGEYRETLMRNIDDVGGKVHDFAAAPAEPATQGDEPVGSVLKRHNLTTGVSKIVPELYEAYKDLPPRTLLYTRPGTAQADDPVAHMWQHEETGRVGFIEHELLADWERMNPRLKIVAPLYTRPQPAPAAVPMADAEMGPWPDKLAAAIDNFINYEVRRHLGGSVDDATGAKAILYREIYAYAHGIGAKEQP